jgi:hypothetical protein
VDRYQELEDLRRSLAMLPPGTKALDRKDAMRLLSELQQVEWRLRNLRDTLRWALGEGAWRHP